MEFNKASFAARATDYVPTELRDQIIAATGLAGPGETVAVTVKVPTQPGRYTYLCTFPGHWVRMYGVMLVVPSLDAFEAKPSVPNDPMTGTSPNKRSCG